MASNELELFTLSKIKILYPKMNWDVVQLNNTTLIVTASKEYLSLRFSISVEELDSRLGKLAKDMANLMS